jgi:uncharacterized protein (DUF58 family)
MPTSRAAWFLFAAFIFYVFGNQTQLGWLYIISALLCGLLPAAALAGAGSLRGLRARRQISRANAPAVEAAAEVDLTGRSAIFHEAEDISVRLRLYHGGRLSRVQVSVQESCPLAAPAAPERQLRLFLPLLPAGDGLHFEYPVTIDRRGVYTFPPLTLATRAPFGFFQRRATLDAPTVCLVYPELRPLKRLALLDRQPAASATRPRAGHGSEVLGVRPFRTGDSPRHVHWRSVARTGRLISKEFADDTQPGLTLVLDRYSPLFPPPESKQVPFELAIKCAASLADYALRRRYSLYLCADTADRALPAGPLTLPLLLEYLARVTAQPRPALPDLLARQPMQAFVAVCVAHPDEAIMGPLLALKQRGTQVLVILPDPATFPAGAVNVSAQPLAGALRRADIDVRELPYGAPWEDLL